MRCDAKLKQKKEEKMKFIYKALQDGYSVRKNEENTYTFSIDRSKDVPLKTFVRRCSSITMNQF